MFRSFDNNIQLDMAILDFSKAFDTVPNKELLNKLHSYGIEGNIHQWLSSFLQNRSVRVVVEGEHSDNAHVDSGVTQGTVLFLCHINDLHECLLYREIKSQQDHQTLQEDLKSQELGAIKGHEIQRKEMLHNGHETEIELLLPIRSAHSRTSKDKSILRT